MNYNIFTCKSKLYNLVINNFINNYKKDVNLKYSNIKKIKY